MKIKTIFSILLLLPLLTGCMSIPFESDAPDEFYPRKSTIGLLRTSPKEDVIRRLGEPDWIEKRGSSTYFIYQAKAYEYVVVFIIFLPVYFSRDTTDVFCLFLKFDEANDLVIHTSESPLDYTKYKDCIDYFIKKNPRYE